MRTSLILEEPTGHLCNVEAIHLLVSVMNKSLEYFLEDVIDSSTVSTYSHPMIIMNRLFLEFSIGFGNSALEFNFLIALLPVVSSARNCFCISINEEGQIWFNKATVWGFAPFKIETL